MPAHPYFTTPEHTAFARSVLGTEPLLDVIADSPELATFIGEQTRILWPADYDLRRIPLVDPVPVYPHSLIWREANPHPALAAFRDWHNRYREVADDLLNAKSLSPAEKVEKEGYAELYRSGLPKILGRVVAVLRRV